MTAFALPFFAPIWMATAPDVKPAPKRTRGPIFIHDCVTPCMGETLLSVMLKRDIEKALAEKDE